jgi:hypothetical protein
MANQKLFRFSVLTICLVTLLFILASQTAAGLTPADPAPIQPTGTYTAYFPIFPAKPTSGIDLQYGIVFISSAEAPADEQQYQNALSLNPQWNRYPLYWFYIETTPGLFNWTAQDTAVQGDIDHNLRTNAILLGTPSFYTTGNPEFNPDDPPPRGAVRLTEPQIGTPAGLYDPIFSDGTYLTGPGKSINASNVWARFVFTAVNRYKPGGLLAQANGWLPTQGVTHWEIWNEPDLSFFWDGTTADYARLLKVGYLAARQADSNARILHGGLANNFNYLNYYADILAIHSGDTLAASFNYFHDILATHRYSNSFQSWFHVDRARSAHQSHGLSKPIWLNETGVPAWDDYPGPVWEPTSPLRATMAEQAHYLIQSTFYAVYGGAEAIFQFQLYDGCGNQPSGTDFPPHNGELCDENGRLIYDPQYPCAGDANGLFRNPPDAVCFSQHPQPETPRPAAAAYSLLAATFDQVDPYWWLRVGGSDPNNGTQEWIAFYRPSTKQRIIGLWARFGNNETAVIPATAGSALLLYPNGSSQTIFPINGQYTLQLLGATNQSAPWDPNLYMIGGRPLILIENDPGRVGPPG